MSVGYLDHRSIERDVSVGKDGIKKFVDSSINKITKILYDNVFILK